MVLAVLTGIHNVITSVKLAKEGNGAAMMSESLNSNDLNIFLGISLPMLLTTLGMVTQQTIFSV